ncbi:hypothetical protein [Candidatus Rariloculus sp.]|uniref:hypothetical protein n=1 Tax=Candidatus Rariloculus sp. TaxID=3101265 RepID=UPI003D0F1CA7
MDRRWADRDAELMLTETDVRTTVANAINFLNGMREPHALLFMGLIHRRFGVKEFADCLERYDEVLPEHPERAPVLRVFRRMFDANNPLQPDDWAHVTIQTDRLLISALYCDRLGLPASFAEALARAVSQGGYAATHALLAWVWVQENDCEPAVPAGFVEDMYGAVTAIIDEDPTSVNDIKLEAGAFLCLARQSARVDLGFVRRVIRFQNDDGGWGRPVEGAGNPDESSWHSTILALIIVLHVRFPGTENAPNHRRTA